MQTCSLLLLAQHMWVQQPRRFSAESLFQLAAVICVQIPTATNKCAATSDKILLVHHTLNPPTIFIIVGSIGILSPAHHEYTYRAYCDSPRNRSAICAIFTREGYIIMSSHHDILSKRILCDIREKRQFLLTRCWGSGMVTE